jgi:hypothetical protein
MRNVYPTDPLVALATMLDEVPKVDLDVLRKHEVSADRVFRYVMFHAAHWNATTGTSRASHKAASERLGVDRRNLMRAHRAALESGLIAEAAASRTGHITPLRFPWLAEPALDEGVSRPTQGGVSVPTQGGASEPASEPASERVSRPTHEQNRTEQKWDARAKRLAEETAAALDANNPLEDSDDPGCDAHKWNGSEKPCGGCRDARLRKDARERQRSAAAERQRMNGWHQEMEKAAANALRGPEVIGIVDRLAAEHAAAGSRPTPPTSEEA